jgi:signal transduction histidine kinase
MSHKRRRTEYRRLMGRSIDRNRGEIESRWLARVQKDIVKASTVEVTQLRDGLPDYLLSIVDLLEGGDGLLAPSNTTAWQRVAREHGVTRVRIGFDIGQLIHEFVLLRDVICDVLESDGVRVEGPGKLLCEILDAAILAAVQAYVEARDHEARERQAESIGFLTHELRNPLSNAVLAASQLRLDASPKQDLALEILERNQQRLSDLIDSVLLAERLISGKMECRPAGVKLGQIMDAALESARATATQKRVQLVTRYDPDLAVVVDPALTQSAVQNLADNAARYTDSGRIDVTVENHEDAIVIDVRDSCEGISQAELRTIFQAFRRGATTKAGTGLGLAIAKSAIEAQGGSLEAESTGPSGCHFWITLPKNAQASAHASAHAEKRVVP